MIPIVTKKKSEVFFLPLLALSSGYNNWSEPYLHFTIEITFWHNSNENDYVNGMGFLLEKETETYNMKCG